MSLQTLPETFLSRVGSFFSPIRSALSLAAFKAQPAKIYTRLHTISDFVSPTCSDIKKIFSRVLFPKTSFSVALEDEKVSPTPSTLDPFLPPLSASHAAPSPKTRGVSSSLLPSVPKEPSAEMTESLFSELFFGSLFSFPNAIFDFYQHHLPKSFQQTIPEALRRKEELEKIVHDQDKAKREKDLLHMAHELADRVKTIGDPLLLHGTLYKDVTKPNPASKFILEHMAPQEFQQLLAGEKGTQILAAIKSGLHTFSSSFPQPAQEIKDSLSRVMDSVFRKIPLPESWKSTIKDSLQTDLREVVLGPSSTHPFAEQIWEKLLREGMEKVVQDAISQVLPLAKNAMEESKDAIFSSLVSALPPLGQDLLSMTGITEHNESVWIEIQKQPDGKLQLTVFSKESDYHQEHGAVSTSEICLPLVFCDIEEKQLSTEFFYQFLSYTAKPHWEKTSFSLNDFFHGLVQSLKRSPNLALSQPVPVSKHTSDQPRALFELYLRHHLHLGEAEFQKFQCDCLLEAFLKMWSHVKEKEDLLAENASLRTKLLRAAQHLYEMATTTYSKEHIPPHITSTLAEANKILRLQEKRAKQKEEHPSFFLPPEVKRITANLLEKIGGKENIAELRDALIEILGEEVREPVDSLICEVLQEMAPKETLSTSFPWKEIFSKDFLRKELAFVTRRPSLLHFYQIYVRYVRNLWMEANFILAYPLCTLVFTSLLPFAAPVNLLLASFLFLARTATLEEKLHLLPKEMFDLLHIPYKNYEELLRILSIPFKIYQELYCYLQGQLMKLFLKITLRSLLGTQKISLIQKSVRQLQQITTRTGEISYELANPVTQTVASEKLLPSVPPSSYTITEAVAESLPIPQKPDCITEKNILCLMAEWTDDTQKLLDAKADQHLFLYLNMQIRLLPPPGGKGDFWAKIAEAEKREILEKIHLLMIRLYNIEVFWAKDSCEKAVSLFTLYAITDFLARECKESLLDGAGDPQGADIIMWAQEPKRQISSGPTYQQLEEVCRYFGYDLTKNYSLEEIEKKQKECFFWYGKFASELSVDWGEFSEQGLPERQKKVYRQFLANPETRKRVETVCLGQSEEEKFLCLFQDPSLEQLEKQETEKKENKPKQIFEGTPAPIEEQRQALMPSFQHPNPRGGLLERSFSLARFSFHLTSHFVWRKLYMRKGFSAGIEEIPCSGALSPKTGWNLSWTPKAWTFATSILNKTTETVHTIFRHRLRQASFYSNFMLLPSVTTFARKEEKQEESYKNLLSHRWQEVFSTQHTFSEFCYFILRDMVHGPSTVVNPVFFPLSRTQEEILREKHTDTGDVTAEAFERFQMISASSKTSHFMRSFDYFCEHYKTLKSNTDLYFFSLLINQLGSLRAQIKENPEVIKTLGHFFHKTLDQLSSQKLWASCATMACLGEEMKDLCTHFAPSSRSYFPDFFHSLWQAYPFASDPLQRANILNFIFSRYENRHPASLSDEEKKDAVFHLLRAQHHSSFLNKDDHWNLNHQRASVILSRFRLLIQQTLNEDPLFRKNLIETLLRDKKVSIPFQPDYEWSGSYPTFECKALALSFSFDTQLKNASPLTFQEFLKKKLPQAQCNRCFFLSPSQVYFPEENLLVEMRKDNSFHIIRWHEKKAYRWLAPEETTSTKTPSDLSYWVEENSSEYCRVLCLSGKELLSSLPAKKIQEGSTKRLQILFEEKQVDQVRLQRIPTATASIALLSWFQPLKQVHTYVNPASPSHIARIEFSELPSPQDPSRPLAFQVQKVDGKEEALSDGAFPGFFIAKKQHDAALLPFSNYLLLENEKHEKKVLLLPQPTSTLIGSFVLKHFSQFSSSPFVESTLRSFLEKENKGKFYTYSLEDKALTSSDPEALSYLLLLAFTRHDLVAAKEYLSQLELLGKGVLFSEQTHSLLEGLILPLLLDHANTTSLEISLRLSALRFENQLLQSGTPQEPSKVFSQTTLEYFLIQIQYNRYLQVVASGQKPYLTPYQERFLLRRLEYANQSYLSSSLASIETKLKQWVESLGLDIFASHFFLPPAIFARQQTLWAQDGDRSRAAQLTETILSNAVKDLGADPTQIPNASSTPLSLLPRIIQLVKNSLFNPYRDNFSSLDQKTLEQFAQTTRYHANGILDLSVELWDLSLENICSNFFLLHRLATNRIPSGWEKDPQKQKLFESKRNALLANLSLLHGRYESFAGNLLLILQKAAENGTTTSSIEAMEAKLDNWGKCVALQKEINSLQEKQAQSSPEAVRKIDKEIAEIRKKMEPLFDKKDSAFFPKDFLPPLFKAAWSECKKSETMHILQSALFCKKNVLFLGNLALSWIGKAALTALPGLGQVLMAKKAVTFCLSLFHSVTTISAREEDGADTAKTQSAPIAFRDSLSQREDQINRLFSSLFEKYFVEDSSTAATIEPPTQLTLDGEEISESSVKTSLEKIQKSLQDYHARPKNASKKLRFKEGASSEALLEERSQIQKEFQRRVDQERKAILQLCKFPKEKPLNEDERLAHSFDAQRKKENRLTFEELFSAFSRGDLGKLVEQGLIPQESQPLIEERFYLLLVMTSRFEFLFTQTATLTPASSDFTPFAEALQKERVYSFEGRSDILRAKLLFEASMKVLLWKRPMEQLDTMLLGNEPKAVLEALMGWGKTFCLIPLANAVESNGHQIVINIWPKTVAATNIESITKTFKKAFGRFANAFHCTRNFLPDPWGLAKVMRRSLFEKEELNATHEDLQALELRCIEDGLSLLDDPKKAREDHNSFDSLRHILASVRGSAKAVIDEFHKLCDPLKNELNHPLGSRKTLPEKSVKLMGKILLVMLKDPKIKQLIDLKALSPTTIDEEQFKSQVAPLILQHICLGDICDFSELGLLRKHQQEFTDYVLGRASRLPSFVAQSKEKELLGLVKGCFAPLLPMILKRIPNVDYARSKGQMCEEFARPSEGNESPDEQSTIRNPYECWLKSAILTLQKGLTKEQIARLLVVWKEKATQEGVNRGISPQETSVAREFSRLFDQELALFSLDESDEKTLIHLQENDSFAISYVEWVISPQIKYFTMNLKSDPFNFTSMFASFYSLTGTPNNDGCFPEGTKVHWDPGTIGESVDLLLQQCREKDSIEILKEKNPRALLEELLVRFFHEDSKASAFIDRGALLNGVDPEIVARAILQFSEKARPSIEGVVYYVGSQQFILERGSTHGILLKDSRIPKEKRITYFDDPHTFAADVPQPGGSRGVVSIGENTTLEQLSQAIWRMRGLKRAKQRLQFVMTEAVKARIASDRSVTIEDIIRFCAKNEGLSLAELNYLSDRYKMQDVVRRAVLDKIETASSEKEALSILKEFRSLLVTKIEINPFLLYGYLDEKVDPKVVFDALRLSLYNIVKDSIHFDPKEKAKMKSDLEALGKGLYPEKVHVYKVDGALVFDSHDDLERSASVAQTSTQQQQVEQQVQVQVEQSVTQKCQLKERFEPPPPPIPWPTTFSPTACCDWQRTTDPSNPHHLRPLSFPPRIVPTLSSGLRDFLSEETTSSKIKMCPSFSSRQTPPIPLISLQEVLQQSAHSAYQKIAPFLDSSIMASPNFIQIFDTEGRNRRVEPFGSFQKPLEEVVVIKETGKPLTILIVDHREAEYFREKLREDRQQLATNPTIKVGLYSVKSRTFLATGKNAFLDEELDEAFSEKINALCFLDGQVTYWPKEQQALTRWISQNPALFKKALSLRHDLRDRTDLAGSDLEWIFAEADRIWKSKKPATAQDEVQKQAPVVEKKKKPALPFFDPAFLQPVP